MWFWLCDDPEISTRMAASWTARRILHFCCSFLYFLYRYTGMPIMTLRQMMIKTMARTTLLMMFSPILKLELRPTISLLFCILELFSALRAILKVFRRRVTAVVADLRPLALLLEEPLLRTSC